MSASANILVQQVGNERMFWTRKCCKIQIGNFPENSNLESDFDRKGFALEIIRQSMKADLLREEQLR